MKIALWGAYQQGNFGDDLMAAAFGSQLQEMGHQVTVFDLDQRECLKYGLTTESNIDDLVKWCDVVVMGGGAVLKNAQYLRAFLNPKARAIELRFFSLARALKRYSRPSYAVSIGSDGAVSPNTISFFRRFVLQSEAFKNCTVRLQKDVRLMESLGKKATFVPDVLLATSDLFNLKPISEKQPRVILNLHKRYGDIGARIVDISGAYPNLEVITFDTHFADYGLNYEWMYGVVPHVSYAGTQATLQLLNDSSAVISSKLHLGICGMSLGAAYVCLGGRGKVFEQLTQLGLQKSSYWDPAELSDRAIQNFFENISSLRDEQQAAIKLVNKPALGHFAELQEWLK